MKDSMNNPVLSHELFSDAQDAFLRIDYPIVALDTDLKTTYCNKAFRHHFTVEIVDDSEVLNLPCTGEKCTLESLCRDALKTGNPGRCKVLHSGDHFSVEIFPSQSGLTLLIRPDESMDNNETDNEYLADRNRLTIQNMGETFLLIDTNLDVIDANPAFCNSLGYKKEEAISMNVGDFDAMLSKEQILTLLSKAEDVQPLIFDTHYRTRNGELLDMEINIFPIYLRNEKLYVALGRNVTAYVNAKKELQKTNDRLQLLSNSTQDALWEVNVSIGEQWSNEIHQRLFGLDKENHYLGLENWLATIEPARREEVGDSYRVAIEQKNAKWSAEYWFRSATGIEYYVFDRSYFEYDAEGKLKRIVGSMLDITELKKVQDQLAAQKNLSESIVNALPGIFVLINDKGRLVRWNKNLESVSGYSSDEITSLLPNTFFDKAERKILDEKFQEAITIGKATFEADLITKGDQRIPYFFSGWKTIVDSHEMIIGTGIDLVEKKESEKSLKRMEQEMMEHKIREHQKLSRAIISAQERERDFMGRELHDNVNQLLAGTRLYLTMAAKKNGEMKNLVQYPLELLDSGINEIRMLSHKYITPSWDINLKAHTKGLIQLLETASVKVNFDYRLEENSYDEYLSLNIYRILQEQVSNILKYAEAQSVKISMSAKDCTIYIDTIDDGIGFDTSGKWEGIGLSNMGNRVEAYSGKIKITSAPGKGTRIHIHIPILDCNDR